MYNLENIYQRLYNEIKMYEPQMSIRDTIIKINQIFHSYDAKFYDYEHPEIFDQLPEIWSEMCKVIDASDERHRVLDFGCGTGFEAMQLIKNVKAENIEKFVCYDLSEEMLDKCRIKVKNVFSQAEFYSNLKDVDFTEKYNILLTNSLLHHLPEGFEIIKTLEPYLSENAIWIAGHEGSVRFMKNHECLGALKQYTLGNTKLRKLLNIQKYPYYIKRAFQKICGDKKNPYKMTALDSVKCGVFKKIPDHKIIGKLVDVYIARDIDDANNGMAFDYEELQLRLNSEWEMVYLKTYGFMGGFYFGSLPRKYQKIYKSLEKKYPKDGGNFCTVWKRIQLNYEEKVQKDL